MFARFGRREPAGGRAPVPPPGSPDQERDMRMCTGRSKMPEGMVFVPSFDVGRPVNELVLDATDPLSKETDYKRVAAKVRKA